MAIRRRQGIKTSTSSFSISDDPSSSAAAADDSASSYSTSSSLAAQAIRASAAHRDSSLSSAYADSAFRQFSSSSSFKDNHNKDKDRSKSQSKDSATYDYASMKSTTEPGGFWGVLARKAKAILEDGNIPERLETPIRRRSQMIANSTGDQFNYSYQSFENSKKMDNPRLRKGLDALTSSLNHIGGTIGNALEEGRTMVENKTADIIQETRKLQIRKKESDDENQVSSVDSPWKQSSMQPTQRQLHTNQETQLKASRDVAMATAAKAKLLLRELKSVKADLAFAKQRCSQLEDENRALREAREKGGHPADDDMIRLQLETLLAEKARLAHENSVYARENLFLREIVEYHQLTMQDVVYLDECIEEVKEVYNMPAVSCMLSTSPISPNSPRLPPEISPSIASQTFDLQTETVPVIVSPEASTSIL